MHQVDFEKLLQVIQVMSDESPCVFIHVALVSPEGAPGFLEVDSDTFKEDLARLIDDGYLALGLLGWDVVEERIQANKVPFPWYEEEETVLRIFRQVCELGVASVKREFDSV